jgi:hypothetical protein
MSFINIRQIAGTLHEVLCAWNILLISSKNEKGSDNSCEKSKTH